ncbi:MAG: tetratricopeptide repeat protein [Steroidobacteraceae bacterium]
MQIAELLQRARALARRAEDEGAKQAYLEVLRRDPTHSCALNELGTLALAGGFRSAARTAYLQAVQHHPGNKIARVNLANVLREQNDPCGARQHYQAALAIDPDLHEAHQGMAWALRELHLDGAEEHWRRGFAGHALVSKPYRGTGIGPPLLLLVSARGGNIPTQLWIDDRHFTIHALYSEFYDPDLPLPPHALVMNAVGDADLCAAGLSAAEKLLAHSSAPLINRPERVRATGRAEIARRLAAVPGVIAPRIEAKSRAALLAADDLRFPLLLRRPGFHAGRYFVHVATRPALPAAVASLEAEQLLVIEYLDARGADRMARKYRVMFIDGVAYPVHLAISADWKVHYFTADMARDAAFREEERRFLDDMPAALGARAMTALGQICTTLGLEYAGIDFALAADGSVLLFEANATMALVPPGGDSIWDYRRPAIEAALEAAARMVLRRASICR